MRVEQQRRVLVCGGRDYTNARNVDDALTFCAPSVVIQGGACVPNDWTPDDVGRRPPHPIGADWFSLEWAVRSGTEWIMERANWGSFGKAAGHIRNRRMQKLHKPDAVLWFPGGRGTENMKSVALAAGIPLIEGEWAAKQWRIYAADALALHAEDMKRWNQEEKNR